MFKYNLLFRIEVLFTVLKCVYISADIHGETASVVFIEEIRLQNRTFVSYVIFSDFLQSSLQCARACFSFTACVSFTYNEMSKSCRTFSDVFINATAGIEETGARYYKTTIYCPTGYTYGAAMCFRIDQSELTKNEAIAVCKTEGGHLVKVDNEAKQHVLVAALDAAYNPDTKNKYYIGGTKVSGVFMFEEQIPMKVFFWGTRTDGGNSDIIMSVTKDYKWMGTNGIYKRNFICEVAVISPFHKE